MSQRNVGTRIVAVLMALLIMMTYMPQMAFADDVPADAKAAAEQVIYDNYLAPGKRIISNGGTGIVHNGNEISVGLKTNGNGSSITSLSFNLYPSASAGYRAGVFLPKDDPFVKYKNPTKPSRVTIKRDTTAHTFTATLKLYDAEISNDDIDNDTATPLATQDFLITLEPDVPVVKDVAVKILPINKSTKEEVKDAQVKLENSSWQTVNPSSDGKYTVTPGVNYYLTIKANGYKDYFTETFSVTEGAAEAKVELEPIVTKEIKFSVKDTKGKDVDSPKINVRTAGFSYTTVGANSDGAYELAVGETYKYTISKTGYSEVEGTITVKNDETIDVVLSKSFNKYNVSFKPQDAAGKALADAKIKVTYEDEEYDYDLEDYVTETYEVAPSNGIYKLDKDTKYKVEVAADGYESVAMADYTPAGENEDITEVITMRALDSADKDALEAIKAKYEAELGALRPDYSKDENINEFVLNRIKGYSDLDTEGVTVSVKSTDDANWIANDGTIHYNSGEINQFINTKNVGCEFTLKKGSASVDLKNRTVTIGWDRDYVAGKIQEDSENLTWDTIKGDNGAQDEPLTANLTLPQIMTSSARTAWSTIKWTSSDESVISIDKTGLFDALTNAKCGTIHAPEKDTEVILTATFGANDNILNPLTEKASDFKTVTKEFKVKVKGTKIATSEDDLRDILETYYLTNNDAAKAAGHKPYENLKDYVTGNVLDTGKVSNDIQLPRYTRIKNENGKDVFKNKEIKVTYEDNDGALTVNGYRVAVDRFVNDTDWNTKLKVTFTRDGHSVSEEIPLTICAMGDELDAELAMMEQAKAHYWDGINDNSNAGKKEVINNLHPFQEMSLDESGNPKWAYDVKNMTNEGIIPDSYFDGGSLDFEAAGYNKFKSSNKSVISHENLLVTRGEKNTKVTISSLLSSEKYGQLAKKYPNNEKLQKLYKQEVSVTVTVKGTSPDADQGDDNKDEKITVKFMLSGLDGERLFCNPSIEVDEDSTAFDVVDKMLKEAGYTYEGGANYISAITTPDGKRIAEKDAGENSGWMYHVNGKAPSCALGQYQLKDGDDIYLFFTRDYMKEDPKQPEYETAEDRIFAENDQVRYYGRSRYDTALEVADALKVAKKTEKFKNIVVAYGESSPDALSGGYLANKMEAPIILVDGSREAQIAEYIKSNLAEGGTVFILGGTGVVSDDFEMSLIENGIVTERLGGNTRYETNLRILERAGVSSEEIMVCSGSGFADSLSASATNRPILLVESTITVKQAEFLNDKSIAHFYVVGGDGAVKKLVEDELKLRFGRKNVTRLAGQDRYETSALVAKTFFKNAKTAVFAYAQNFPDGLSGSTLAMALGAPVVLTDNTSGGIRNAKEFVRAAGASKSVTLGGETLISNTSRDLIMDK